jgi:hypothetical protein
VAKQRKERLAEGFAPKRNTTAHEHRHGGEQERSEAAEEKSGLHEEGAVRRSEAAAAGNGKMKEMDIMLAVS